MPIIKLSEKRLRHKQAEALQKRNNPPFPLPSLLEFRDLCENYLAKEDTPWQEYEAIEKIERALQSRLAYLRRLRKETEIIKPFTWAKWINDLKPLKGERRRRVSPLFWDVYEYLWNHTLTHQKCLELAEEKGFAMYEKNGKKREWVFVIVDAEGIANKHQVSAVAVRNQISKWTEGPLIKAGMTRPKNEGGKMILAIGCWGEWGQRIPFFTRANSEEWLREVLFAGS